MNRVQGITGRPERERFELALPYHWRLCWRVGVETGLRIGDILNLRREQLAEQCFIVQEVKTGKYRSVYLSESLRRALLDISGWDWVFWSRVNVGEPMTRQAAYRAFKRAADRVGITWAIGCHSARKTAAQDAYSGGASLDDVSAMLNHASVTTTMAYLFDFLERGRGMSR